MTRDENRLLLSVARLLRAHLSDHINEGPCHKYSHEDFRDLQGALKPFDAQLSAEIKNGSRQPERSLMLPPTNQGGGK
jgi:hypothetical protein